MNGNASIRIFSILTILFITVACATLPANFERVDSYALTDTDNTRLGQTLYDEKKAYPERSGFRLLDNGLDAFVARAILSQRAERSIDAQYYLYHNDLTGRLFTSQLLKAADRGVRVRLLVDDIALAGRDLGAAAMDSHPHMEVRIFNPFSRRTSRASQFVTRLGSVTRRMHNKSFTVDNQITILGGRNIGNEYFEADPELAFTDLDVMAIGPAVAEVSASFDQYWNSELAYPATVLKGEPPTATEINQWRQSLDKFVNGQTDSAYLQALQASNLAKEFSHEQVRFDWGEAKVIYDPPEKLLTDFDKTEYHLLPRLAHHFDNVRQELIIYSPYFVPGEQGAAFLSDLSGRGVRVRILTNSLASTDVGIVHAGYMKYRKDLLRAGVELYEMNKKLSRKERKEKRGEEGSSKASLHAKSFVFDRREVFIGSLNLDPRAIVHNTEIGVVFNSPAIAKEMGVWFDENIDQLSFRLELQKNATGSEKLLWHGLVDGKPHIFDVEPYAGFWRRLGIGFMSLWPIESQL